MGTKILSCTLLFARILARANNGRITFRSHSLVYVSSKGRKTDRATGWITIADCAQRNIDLSIEYPQSKKLFGFLLADSKDKVESLFAQASQINLSNSLDEILQLLLHVDEALVSLNKGRITHLMNKFKQHTIFPVTRTPGTGSYELLQSSIVLDWLIADRPHLRDSFAGKVPLLAFMPKEIHSLSNLLKAMNLDIRKLSTYAKGKEHARGLLKMAESHTKHLRSRANFLTV